MKHKLVFALAVVFVVKASAEEYYLDSNSNEDLNNWYNSLNEARAIAPVHKQFALLQLMKKIQSLPLSELNQLPEDEINNDIPVRSEFITTNDESTDQLITGAEIKFDTAELNILRDNDEANASDQVHKKEDQKVGQEQPAEIGEVKDDDDGEEDKEEDIEEEEERYDDDTDLIRKIMVESESDIYLQSFVIFVSGFVLGGAISFFFMSVRNRYRDMKEVQLVLEPKTLLNNYV